MITIWKYENAPKYLRDLRQLPIGGTWVLQASASVSTELKAILRSSSPDVYEHEMVDGTVVFFCHTPEGCDLSSPWFDSRKHRITRGMVPAGFTGCD